MTATPRTILVVEDELITAKQLQHTLTALGYHVPHLAASADEAIHSASIACPDLVLMDIRIKGDVTGIEAAEILRTRFGVPVIFVTAYADQATLDKAKGAEPLAYLVKPVKDLELQRSIELALQRSELERKLREREHWFATTLRSIADAVVAADASGHVAFMNLAAEGIVGLEEHLAVGRRLADIFGFVDEQSQAPLENPLSVALRDGRVASLPGPATLVTPAGERTIEDSAAPIIDANGRLLGAVLVFRDVSEQRRLERQIVMADRLRALGTLISGVAHEINNPLTAVLANASYATIAVEALTALLGDTTLAPDVVAKRIGPPVAELFTVLSELQEGVIRVRSIVDDLQAFSRPQEPTRQRVEVRAAVEAAVRIAGPKLRERARLTLDFGPAPVVRASEVRLGQVFMNLLLNAAQAIPEGEPARHEIHVATATDTDGNALVSVRDSGSGMTPAIRERIFEPFFTTKGAGQGTGLGLSICHGIVKSYGGTITVASAPGAGSTFTVTLPPARAE